VFDDLLCSVVLCAFSYRDTTSVGKSDISQCECGCDGEFETPLKCVRYSDRCVDQYYTIDGYDMSHRI
jgi:hypothetical protein